MNKKKKSVQFDDVRLTHPDKELFPKQGFTKHDVAAYLAEAAPRLLAHTADRFISLVRCPEGQSEPCFFQRHKSAGFNDGVHIRRVRAGRKGEDYIYIDGLHGLMSLAQMGVLEIHIWGSHVDTVDRPDRLVFDLDPAPELDFATVKAGAFRVRDVLKAIGLKSFPLLSGGKGIHVVVPLLAEHKWDVVKEFSRTVAERIAADEPDRYIATMTKSKRRGKIFIDFFRNDETATAIAPYSTRARPDAPLAWPVTWKALPRIKSANAVSLGNYRTYLKAADPWRDYAGTKQRLTEKMLKALGVKA